MFELFVFSLFCYSIGRYGYRHWRDQTHKNVWGGYKIKTDGLDVTNP